MDELFIAVAKNDTGRLAQLLHEGADPNTKDRKGRTLLMHCAVDGKDSVVNVLIEYGADVNAQDEDGFSPLHFAAQEFQLSIAELLLRAGAQVDPKDRFGNTPLWRAVFNSRGRGEMIRLLLQHGADRLTKNLSGRSPVELAGTIANYDVKRFFS